MERLRAENASAHVVVRRLEAEAAAAAEGADALREQLAGAQAAAEQLRADGGAAGAAARQAEAAAAAAARALEGAHAEVAALGAKHAADGAAMDALRADRVRALPLGRRRGRARVAYAADPPPLLLAPSPRCVLRAARAPGTRFLPGPRFGCPPPLRKAAVSAQAHKAHARKGGREAYARARSSRGARAPAEHAQLVTYPNPSPAQALCAAQAAALAAAKQAEAAAAAAARALEAARAEAAAAEARAGGLERLRGEKAAAEATARRAEADARAAARTAEAARADAARQRERADAAAGLRTELKDARSQARGRSTAHAPAAVATNTNAQIGVVRHGLRLARTVLPRRMSAWTAGRRLMPPVWRQRSLASKLRPGRVLHRMLQGRGRSYMFGKGPWTCVEMAYLCTLICGKRAKQTSPLFTDGPAWPPSTHLRRLELLLRTPAHKPGASAQVAELAKEVRRLGREAAEKKDALTAAAAAEAAAAALRVELASARQGAPPGVRPLRGAGGDRRRRARGRAAARPPCRGRAHAQRGVLRWLAQRMRTPDRQPCACACRAWRAPARGPRARPSPMRGWPAPRCPGERRPTPLRMRAQSGSGCWRPARRRWPRRRPRLRPPPTAARPTPPRPRRTPSATRPATPPRWPTPCRPA
jgi:chemotaxis protein histidine kinase CheA